MYEDTPRPCVYRVLFTSLTYAKRGRCRAVGHHGESHYIQVCRLAFRAARTASFSSQLTDCANEMRIGKQRESYPKDMSIHTKRYTKNSTSCQTHIFLSVVGKLTSIAVLWSKERWRENCSRRKWRIYHLGRFSLYYSPLDIVKVLDLPSLKIYQCKQYFRIPMIILN